MLLWHMDGENLYFCSQHPKISLRSAAVLSYARLRGASQEAIDQYFRWYKNIILENIFTEYDLLDKPGSTFNMDETGMPIDHKTFTAKGGFRKNQSYVSSVQRTVVGCISAAGVTIILIPPMVELYTHKRCTTVTSSGWMDQELLDWLCSQICFTNKASPTIGGRA